MKCSEWMEKLEKLAPKSLACEWDNPGLLAGRAEKEVKKVLIALDATDDVVDLAVKEQVDLLITHHPLIFHSMKKVNDQDFIGRRLIKLIQADISMYAMHTNFDIAPGCMADLAAEKLGLVECEPLETMKVTDEGAVGIGKTGIKGADDLKSPGRAGERAVRSALCDRIWTGGGTGTGGTDLCLPGFWTRYGDRGRKSWRSGADHR